MVEADWPVAEIRLFLGDRRETLILLKKALEKKTEVRRDKNRAVIAQRIRRTLEGKRVLRRGPKLRPRSREYFERILQYRGEIAMLEAGLAALSTPERFARAIQFARCSVNVSLNPAEIRYFQRGLEKQFKALTARFLPNSENQDPEPKLRSADKASLGWRVRARKPVDVRLIGYIPDPEWELKSDAVPVIYERVRVNMLRARIYDLGRWEIDLASNAKLRSDDRDRVWLRGLVLVTLFEETVGKIQYQDLLEGMARVRSNYVVQKQLVTGKRSEKDLWSACCDEVDNRLKKYIDGARLKKLFRKTRPSSVDFLPGKLRPKGEPRRKAARMGA